MTNEKFIVLMNNIKNSPPCDLKPMKKDLYNVTFTMTDKQLKEYSDLLISKGIAYREYGNVFIYGVKECVF